MQKLYTFLIAIVFSTMAFSVSAKDVCPKECLESVITDGLKDSPELLIKVLNKDEVQDLYNKMRVEQLLLGSFTTEKIYVIKSEGHDDAVYLFFVDNGCIVDVKMTSKKLVLSLLE